MGVGDIHRFFATCDVWLIGECPWPLPVAMRAAADEQGFDDEFLRELQDAWREHLFRTRGSIYGYGWRVWYPDGQIVTSLEKAWRDLRPGMIGAVSYLGHSRYLVQGRDPFYLEHGLPRSVPAEGVPPNALDPKEGTWVEDDVMRQWRRTAVLSFSI